MFKNQRKRKYGNEFFYINLHLKDRLDIEFTACYGELMPEGAPTPFTACDAYHYFAGRALLSHAQNIYY